MLFAYKITGDFSNKCEFCDTQEEANALQVQGYFISETAINWTTHMYVDGEIKERPIITPTPEEIKAQKLLELDSEYQPQFMELTRSWANAYMDGNTTNADSIKATKIALTAEYYTKKEVIENA